MNAVEKFIAGKGRLAAVLGAMPFFESSAALARNIQDAARAEERTLRACEFEPPANLGREVLAAARALDEAQSPRREALWTQIARGDEIDAALGAPVNADTANWLREQARLFTTSTPPAATSRPARRWWTLGLSVGLTFFVAILAQRYFLVAGNDAAPQMQDTSVALLSPSPPRAEAAPPPPPGIMAETEPFGGQMADPVEAEPLSERAAQAKPAMPSRAAAVTRPRDQLDANMATAENKSIDMAERQRAALAPAVPDMSEHAAVSLAIDAPQWSAVIRHGHGMSSDLPARSAKHDLVWQLSASDPTAPEFQALAKRLREALPAGDKLETHADPAIPAGQARLMRRPENPG
ncbi:MAG: hypothetical protein LBB76_08710 [Azoarcus sp.]|jgi:hypothetical protein|nr:hypothetical protein [Azoarcus sp.]